MQVMATGEDSVAEGIGDQCRPDCKEESYLVPNSPVGRVPSGFNVGSPYPSNSIIHENRVPRRGGHKEGSLCP